MRFLKNCSLLALFSVFCLLAGCQTSGPEKTLSDTAKALTDKDSGAFLAQFDMDAFASHELVNLKQDNSLLNFTSNLGSLLGIGSEMDAWLNSAMDLKQQYTRTFTRTVGSGELVNQCTRSMTPDCPWDPQALKKAEVKQINEQCAVARVTTQANMTSWIALRKVGENWRIVGKAVLEDTAVRFATDEKPLLDQSQPKPAQQPADESGAQSI